MGLLTSGIRHMRREGLASFVRHASRYVTLRFVHLRRTFAKRLAFHRATLRLRLRPRRASLGAHPDPKLVVSLTSFPARIGDVWATIETLLGQRVRPDRIVLVLSRDEFRPARRVLRRRSSPVRLPSRLRQQQRRGLEILWVDGRLRSYNKLLPVRRAYPTATIITVDDDALYADTLVGALVAHAAQRPGTVVGHRAWRVQRDAQGLRPYVEWMRSGPADTATASADLFLTGVGGVLYPPMPEFDELLLEERLALTLAPDADDVWFWVVQEVTGTPRSCTGESHIRQVTVAAEASPLFAGNRAANDRQLRAVLEHFGRALPAPGAAGAAYP